MVLLAFGIQQSSYYPLLRHSFVFLGIHKCDMLNNDLIFVFNARLWVSKMTEGSLLIHPLIYAHFFQSQLQGRILWDESWWLCRGVCLLLFYISHCPSCRGAPCPSGWAVWRGGERQQGSVVLLCSGEWGGGAEGGLSGADRPAAGPAVSTRWFHMDQSGCR